MLALEIDHRHVGVELAASTRLRLRQLDPDSVVGDHDLVLIVEDPRLHPLAVDVGAVVGAEVLDRPLAVLAADAGVLARHPHVRHEDLAVRPATDDVVALPELVPPTSVRPGLEDETGHF